MTSELEAIIDSVQRFAKKKIEPIADAHWHKANYLESEVPIKLVQQMGELGFFGIAMPEKFGGSGMDYTTMAKVTEILSGAWLAAGSIATRSQITCTALLKYGTKEQKEKWLPQLTSGKKLNAIAVTEPDYGSDIGNLITKAQRDGNEYVLNGTKTWATYAHRAHVLTVLARTGGEGHKGLSLFLVEKPSGDRVTGQGISGSYIPTTSYHGIPSFEVVFENCRVPAENLVGGDGGIGKGFYATLLGFQEGRLQTAARSVGVAQAAYNSALSYANVRKQFGKTIIEFQAVEHALAEMFVDIAQARALTYHACEAMGQNPEQARALCYAAKLNATQTVDRVTRNAMEIVGAYSVAQEYSMSRYLGDARVLHLFEGPKNIQLNMIARETQSQ